jgi:hypothetical protein
MNKKRIDKLILAYDLKDWNLVSEVIENIKSLDSLEEKKCSWCEGVFKNKNPRTKFCSTDCSKKYHQKRTPKGECRG